MPRSNGTMRLEKLLTASNSFVAGLFAARLPDRGLRARDGPSLVICWPPSAA